MSPRRQTLRKRLAGLVVAALLCGTAGSASAQLAPGPATEWAQAVAVYEQMAAEFAAVEDQYERQVAIIESFGVADQTVEVWQLREQHQRAQALADQLVALDSEIRRQRAAVLSLQAAYADDVRAEMLAIEGNLASGFGFSIEQAIRQLNSLSAILASLEQQSVEVDRVPVEAILRDLPETPEELRAAAAELADNEARLMRQLEDVRRQLGVVASQDRLEQRAREMAAAESFFEASGRVVVRQTELATNQPQSDRTNTGTDEESNGVPAVDEPVRGGPTETDAAAPSTDAEAGAIPEFGSAEDSDGLATGGDPGTSGGPEGLDLGSELAEPSRSALTETSVVVVGDPSLARDGNVGANGSAGAGRANPLRDREAELLQLLEQVRLQRIALENRAQALEN